MNTKHTCARCRGKGTAPAGIAISTFKGFMDSPLVLSHIDAKCWLCNGTGKTLVVLNRLYPLRWIFVPIIVVSFLFLAVWLPTLVS